MLRMVLALTGLFFISFLSAQVCGTPQEPLLTRVDINKASPEAHQRSAQKYIPITFHLVALANGSGRVKEEDVFKQLANLNTQYSDQQAVFYLDHLNYFDNDAVYNEPASAPAITQMRLRRDNNSMNIFITGLAESGSGSPGVTLAYYEPNEDWIVSRRDQISGISSTLAHEIGHFFSLPHPFSGWDCHPFTLNQMYAPYVYTNPVSQDFTYACEGGGGSLLIELQNGTNCNIAGDRICDTPPDYNMGLLYQDDCDTNSTVKDKNSTLIRTQVNNYMSYFRQCSSYVFTPNQKTLINADFFSSHRVYIRTGVVPNLTPVTEPVDYISPVNGESTNGPTDIVLDWEDTPGANKYMVLIAQNASFTINAEKYFVSQSTLTLPEDLMIGSNYFWKVWPYNESQTGAMYSATQNFRVGEGVGVNEIKEINQYVLSPNPVIRDQPLSLILTSIKTFEAELEVSSASGQILFSKKLVIPSGTSHHEIETANLPGGIYFIIIHASSGTFVERLLVTE